MQTAKNKAKKVKRERLSEAHKRLKTKNKHEEAEKNAKRSCKKRLRKLGEIVSKETNDNKTVRNNSLKNAIDKITNKTPNTQKRKVKKIDMNSNGVTPIDLVSKESVASVKGKYADENSEVEEIKVAEMKKASPKKD